MKILLIPDSHVTQTSNLDRFRSLGYLIAERRPDVIISMGDFTAYNSISHWDSKKRLTMEGRRYAEEVAQSNIALDLITNPLHELQRRQKEQKLKQYKPRKYFLIGNHSMWIEKYLEQNPQLEGHIGLEQDLKLLKRGWQTVPFGEYLEIEDILFTHIPLNGAKQAISGADICRIASRYTSKSLVFAHTHRLETLNLNRLGGGNLIQILSCGCFFEDSADGFGGNNWKGVIFLDVFAPGRFEIETYSIERLRYEI